MKGNKVFNWVIGACMVLLTVAVAVVPLIDKIKAALPAA